MAILGRAKLEKPFVFYALHLERDSHQRGQHCIPKENDPWKASLYMPMTGAQSRPGQGLPLRGRHGLEPCCFVFLIFLGPPW